MKKNLTDAEVDARMAAAMDKRKKEMEQVKSSTPEPTGVLNGPKNKKQLEAMMADYKSDEEREREEEEESNNEGASS